VKNLQDDLGANNVTIEIVAYGRRDPDHRAATGRLGLPSAIGNSYPQAQVGNGQADKAASHASTFACGNNRLP